MSSATSNVTKQSEIIRAGAGAGKTTRLIKTFLDFVKTFKEENSRYPRIILTTFTRKATQEIKERLLLKALKEHDPETFEYINKKSYVHISTIHSVLSMLLSQFSEKIKLPIDIKILDAAQYNKIIKKHINDLFKRKPDYIELLETLSFSDLTSVSITAIDFKIQNKSFSYVNKSELLKIREQRRQLLLQKFKIIFGINQQELNENWRQFFQYLESLNKCLVENRLQDYSLILKDKVINKPRFLKKTPPFDESINELIEDIIKENLPLASDFFIEKHEVVNKLFFEFINELSDVIWNYKLNAAELTIADLESYSLVLLEKYPEVATEFRSNWDYFMLDEYQDTSPLQVKILNYLIGNKPCFIVGDPQQSIYLFRGARSEVFENKFNEMKKNNSLVGTLEKNYRSEPVLMRFVNHFFNQISTNFKPMQLKDDTGYVDNKIAAATFITGQNESVVAVKRIQELIQLGVEAKDICILSAKHKNLIRVAEIAAKSGIQVQLGSSDFEEKREILDLVAFNRFLCNPHDNENLILLLRSPWLMVPDQEILNLAQDSVNKHSLWRQMCMADHPRKKELSEYLNLYDQAGSLYSTQQFIKKTSFLDLSEYYDHTGRREANVFKFLMLLAEAERQSGFLLGQFLNEKLQSFSGDLAKGGGEAQPVVQPDCVTLMTVHAAKGLEFKHVIVVGFSNRPNYIKNKKIVVSDIDKKISLAIIDDENDGKLVASDWAENVLSDLSEREAAESERVLYVALTRAISSLSLIAEVKNERAPNKNTWYHLCNWPTVGEFVKDGFRISSVTYDESIEIALSQIKNKIAVREPYLSLNELDNLSTQSVTEALTAANFIKANYDFKHSLLNLKKAQKGTDLHKLFESLKYRDTNDLLAELNLEDQEIVNYLLEQRELNIKEIVAKGHCEWGFGIKTKNYFRQGQIDLWAELEDEVHVLDYKTGSSKNNEKAMQQISIYALYLHQMNMFSPAKKIILSAVYPVEKTIITNKYINSEDFLKKIDPKIKALI